MSSSKTTCSSMPHLPGLLLMSLTPRQATVNPRCCQRLLNTHRQFWLPETPEHSQAILAQSLGGHCSFLLGPGVHTVLFVPSKNLFPQSYVSSGGSTGGAYAIPTSAAPRAPAPVAGTADQYTLILY